MTYGEFEAQILFEYPETDPTYLSNLIRKVLAHINTLTRGRYIEEKMIKFTAGSGTASTGYTWATPVLTLPAGLVVIEIVYLDLADNRRFTIDGFDWEGFFARQENLPVYHWMSPTSIYLAAYSIAASCELWVKGRKQVALTAITTPSTVLSVPDEWLPVLERGVLTELSAGTEKWKNNLPEYREMLAALKISEDTNYPNENHEQEYNYATSQSSVPLVDDIDDGIHNWWAP